MMDIPLPTTEQVRADYAEDNFGRLSEFHTQQFDRWLNSVKRQVWDEGFSEGKYYGEDDLFAKNPYREEQ